LGWLQAKRDGTAWTPPDCVRADTVHRG